MLVSSHLMSELEDTADHLVIVGRGKVIADTSVAGLLAAASGDRALLRTTDPDRAAMVLERAGASVTVTGAGLLTVTGLDTGQISALLAGQAVPFSELSAHRATLEEAYLGLTQDAVEYRAEAAGGAAVTPPRRRRPSPSPPPPTGTASPARSGRSGPSSARCAAG